VRARFTITLLFKVVCCTDFETHVQERNSDRSVWKKRYRRYVGHEELCAPYSVEKWDRSNQDFSDINNTHIDLVISPYNRRVQNIDKKTKSVRGEEKKVLRLKKVQKV